MDNQEMNLVGRYIRKARTNKKLSAKYVADYLEVSQQFICNIERGSALLPIRLVRKLCQVLDMDPIMLIEEMADEHGKRLLAQFEELVEYDA